MHHLFTKPITLFSLFLLVFVACNAPATPAPAGYFKVTVIVDTTTDPVSQEQAEAILAIANEKLINLTGFGFQLHEFVESDTGRPMGELVENYMNQTTALPNGILIFSTGDEDRAKLNRAYAQQFLAPAGFSNAFVSPYLGDGYMYVAVLQFNYRYAACGYAGTDTIQSSASMAGECPGDDGQVCELWEGMQVCPAARPLLEGHTPIDMASGPVVHEFMHSFSDKGQDDHYTSEACHKAMGWEPGHYYLEEAEHYAGFCPNVYEVFANSYRP